MILIALSLLMGYIGLIDEYFSACYHNANKGVAAFCTAAGSYKL
ncbi:MAG: hypothetical protein PHY90_07680 [Desulfitobacteriaceae bacterium]|nr:hypothetical protein [Desulfitobacteriaceae bacterium]